MKNVDNLNTFLPLQLNGKIPCIVLVGVYDMTYNVYPFLLPSQYLDTQHIHNLTTYLQALHRTGSATADHTSLLLNCYTRLRDTQQLNEFIMV